MISKNTTSNTATSFIMGGGEMGELIRHKDWSQTEVGSPENWPLTLKITINFLLNSKFPMFLWWGPGLICFYNDAYRPSLGNNGKHPHILGMRAKEAWPEIWDIIKPLIDQVLTTGEATWSENQLVPIYRNGTIEDVYWTFSYSPVLDEFNTPNGVFVTCVETTQQVNSLKAIEQHEEQLQFTIDATDLGTWELNLQNNELNYAGRYLKIFGHQEDAQVSNENLSKQIHRDDEPIRLNAFTKALTNGVLQFRCRIVWNDESVHWVEVKGKVFYNDNQEPVKVIGTIQDITEEQTYRQTLTESEEKFRLLADSMPQFVWTSDPAGNLNYYNQSIYDYSGISPEKAKMDKWLDLVHPDDREENLQRWMEAINTGQEYTFEHRFRYKDGNYYWHLSRAIPQRDAQGNIQMWVGTSSDIHAQKAATSKLEKSVQEQIIELKRLNEALKKSEERYHQMVEEIQDYAIFYLNEQGIVQNWNKGAENIKRYTAQEIVGKSFVTFYPAQDRENQLPEKLLEQARLAGRAGHEGWRVRKDGSLFWASVIITAIHNEQNEVIGFSKVTHDLTEKKKIEDSVKIHAQELEEKNRELKLLNETLKKSEERYHLMVEEVEDYAILYLNRDGIVENWNQGAQKIKGYKAEEIIGKSFSLFYTQEDKEKHLPQTLLAQAVNTGKALQEGWRVRKDGSLFWASVVITAVHNERNEVIGFSKVTHDLTEKKKVEDRIKANSLELEEKNRELERMNTELQSFAYVSSHDLQEPLRKIKTFSGRLLDKEKQNLSDSGKDILHRINNSVNRMQVLIEDILAYSRTNTVERIFVTTDLKELINEVKDDFRESITEKNAIIEVETTCQIKVIQFQFKQLLSNLIGNSLKFSKPDIPPLIQIKSLIINGYTIENLPVNPSEKYCHITIADNGIGFNEAYKERIFEIFQRLHGKSEYKGTGIGLAIVKKIVENHDGFITAAGEENQGARFDIYLPMD